MVSDTAIAAVAARATGVSCTAAAARLHVFLANAGVASRRAGERLIAAGRVAVNGRVVAAQGTVVGPTDRVTVDGREVTAAAPRVYLALHKPAGYLCSNAADPRGRPLARELLPTAERVYHVGRLDLASCGLLLFTNDGRLALRVTHPAYGVEKEYEVVTGGPLPEAALQRYQAGYRIGDIVYRLLRYRRGAANRVRLTLVEGRNREIRRVLGDAGIAVRRLTRVRVGPVTIRGLAAGDWRPLTTTEVAWFLDRARHAVPAGPEAPAAGQAPARWGTASGVRL